MGYLVASTFPLLAVFLSIMAMGVTSQETSSQDVDQGFSLLVVDTDMGTDDAMALMVLLEAEKRHSRAVTDVDPGLSLLVVDTDMGTDDAMALMVLLEAEKRYYRPETSTGPKIIAVTCANGNTAVDNVVSNVLKILNLTGRLDGSIQVHRGAAKSIMYTPAVRNYFGADGMGDVPGGPAPGPEHVNGTHAAVALVDLVNRHPGKVTLLALGPLTNIALAIRLDEQFLNKLKHLLILGGSTEGRGNKTPGTEVNFYMDPEANYVVLRDTDYRNGTVSLVSWEQITKMKVPYQWRKEVLGALETPRMRYLNAVEGITRGDGAGPAWVTAAGWWEMADPVAAAVLLRPEMAQHRETLPLAIFTEGEARGGIAVDHYRRLHGAREVTLVVGVHVDQYQKLLLDYFST